MQAIIKLPFYSGRCVLTWAQSKKIRGQYHYLDTDNLIYEQMYIYIANNLQCLTPRGQSLKFLLD